MNVFFAILLAVQGIFAPAAWAQQWQEEKGDHFIVFHAGASPLARETLYKAEKYYVSVAGDLGYSRYDSFWQWDNRVKIYIHPDKDAFRKATGQPAWSDGMASYLDKSIHTIEGTEDFVNSVLPHEITHLVFRDFVGFKGPVPLWLDEGVAQWEEKDKRAQALEAMPVLLRRAEAFTLKSLTGTDIRTETNPNRVGVFYIQSISVVDYLIRTYGAQRFTQFCRDLRDGKRIEDALRSFSSSIADLDSLEDQWSKHVLSMPIKEES